MFLLSQPLTKAALQFGPSDLFAVTFMGLSILTCLDSDHILNCIISGLIGLLLACVVGILWGLVRAKRGQQGLPWGPGIALAAWCAALFGQNLIDWYLSLL